MSEKQTKLKICMAQMDIDPGKPGLNANKMFDWINKAAQDKADIIIFPEMAVPGYMIGDMWERGQFLMNCWSWNFEFKDISEKYPELLIVFGNVEDVYGKKNEDGRIRKYNACFSYLNGNATVNHKTLMPNYRGFDDSRHFYDNRKDLLMALNNPCNPESAAKFACFKTVKFKGLKIGFIECEDGWDTDYEFKVLGGFPFTECDLIVNISCSPYTFNKNGKRNRVFSEHAKNLKIPIAYVNCVGVQNIGKTIYTFDGNSCIYDKNGNQLNPYNSFEEGHDVIEVDLNSNFGDENFSKDKETIADLYKAIRYGTKKFMEQQGISKIVIGASGGMDSCLSAAIYADIVSPENLYLVNMPYLYNSKTTIGIAEKLAKNIGCNYISIPIGSTVDAIKNVMQPLESYGKLTDFMVENVQARARLQTLATFTAMVGGVFTCNSNKSETTVGYCTFYGDLSGWLANLADLWKTQVYEMAKWYNENVKNVIPAEAFTVKPSAELSVNQNVDEGKGDPLIYSYHDQLFKAMVEKWDRLTDEDLRLAYSTGSICEIIEYKYVYEMFPTFKLFNDDLTKWWKLYNGLAIAKRVQAPPILCVSRRAFGFDLREAIIKP